MRETGSRRSALGTRRAHAGRNPFSASRACNPKSRSPPGLTPFPSLACAELLAEAGCERFKFLAATRRQVYGDLHFHDLRHEGASRLHEAGWPLHHVQEVLALASLEQTSTYLNVARGGLRASMAKSDEARSRCNSVVNDAAIEHPTPYNDGGENAHKSTIN